MEQAHHTKQQFVLPMSNLKKGNRDIGNFFSSMPSWALFIIIGGSYTLILAIGNYFGYQRFASGAKDPASPTEPAIAAVLGLLAFLLGFAFSATWTRYIRRNVYVVSHAKAICACYLRCSLIPEKQKVQARKILYEYTTILLRIQTTADLMRAVPEIDELHSLLWQEATSLVKEDIDSEIRSLFIASANDLINLALERKTVAMFIRIPNAIWTSLLLLALIGILAFGYQAGINGMHTLVQMPLLPVTFGLVMVLIADLNSRDSKPQFKIIKRPLKEVLNMMEKEKS
jgi:hypothetical protein